MALKASNLINPVHGIGLKCLKGNRSAQATDQELTGIPDVKQLSSLNRLSEKTKEDRINTALFVPLV
ncbi:hypothetical protein [Draconibacterium mangrovi]|uniref:hypothetical protein n=1 Tax=Draconibacterium mangrovi TaxID=2697469 RepID=UPI0013D74CD8|nr:hypothetical protein [Draconibacterium mangrovi]